MVRSFLTVLSFAALCGTAIAQVLTFPSSRPNAVTTSAAMNLLQTAVMDTNIGLINTLNHSPMENPAVALSRMDLKAPGKARHEYEKGYRFLAQKKFTDAVAHLQKATEIYPSYVSGFNGLGAAYLALGQTDQAQAAFQQAISLDDHLPNSYLNLGCAELAKNDYAAAERDIEKASQLAPLDMQVRTALAYSQYMNNDYPKAIATAGDVHARKHEGAALVHFYAAAAHDAAGNPASAQSELQLLIKEDPKSSAAGQAKILLVQLQDEVAHPRKQVQVNSGDMTLVSHVAIRVPGESESEERKKQQDEKERVQLAEAEALNAPGTDSGAAEPEPAANAEPSAGTAGYTFRVTADEVAVLFAASDHGKAVSDLSVSDVRVLDGRHAPAVITGFRNEAELPLRIALVIDSSASIASRFKFEQEAAGDFLQKVVTGPNDLGFVVGFSNMVLVAQDFTHDPKELAHSIGQLAPSGGTALWDAVKLASEKLAKRQDSQPVAKILVVISDGEDNSSVVTAKDAIEQAQRDEVTVYTVNTLEITNHSEDAPVGVRALKLLAETTGGASFIPGSARWLNGSFNDLQQVIRSRYLITYKPQGFKRDGSYRHVQISAEKNGHKLRVVSRNGYYANARPNGSD